MMMLCLLLPMIVVVSGWLCLLDENGNRSPPTAKNTHTHIYYFYDQANRSITPNNVFVSTSHPPPPAASSSSSGHPSSVRTCATLISERIEVMIWAAKRQEDVSSGIMRWLRFEVEDEEAEGGGEGYACVVVVVVGELMMGWGGCGFGECVQHDFLFRVSSSFLGSSSFFFPPPPPPRCAKEDEEDVASAPSNLPTSPRNRATSCLSASFCTATVFAAACISTVASTPRRS